MIGGLLGMAANMAAWQAAAYASKKVGGWMASTARRGIVKYSKYLAEAAYSTRAQQIAKKAFRMGARVMGEVSLQPGDVTEELINSRVAAFRTRMTQAAQSRVGRISNQTIRRTISTFGRVAKDEVSFLPANYIMYRIEKARAITPEDRESTKSFMKYYAGVPMVMSMGIGAISHARAGAKSGTGAIGRGAQWFAKRYSRPIRSVMLGGMNLLEASVPMAERAVAAMRARRTMTEGRGLLSLIGTHRPDQVWSAFKDHYGNQLRHLRGTKSDMLGTITRQMDTVESQVYRMAFGKNLHEIPDQDMIKYRLTPHSQAMHAVRESIYEGYIGEMSRKSKTLSFVNKVLEASGNNDIAIRRSTRKISLGGQKVDAPIGPGRLTMGNREYDLGPLSLSFMRDALLKRADRGGPRFALSLFGQREMLEHLNTEDALTNNWKLGKNKARMVFPFSLTDDVSSHDNIEDVGLIIMGKKPQNASDADRELAKAFVDNRVNMYKTLHGVSQPEAQTMFLKSARHGELLIRNTDILLQGPGGSLNLLMQGEVGGKQTMLPITIGGAPGVEGALKYHRFTSHSNSIITSAIRRFVGNEKHVIQTGTNVGESVTMGPVPIGRVNEDVTTPGIIGKVRHFLHDTLELGRSQDRGILARMGSIFFKHTDPRNPTTLFSRDYIQNPEFLKDLTGNPRNVKEFIDVLHEQMVESSDMFYMNLVAKAGKSPGRGTNTQKLKAYLSNIEEGFQYKYSPQLIHGDMSMSEAKQTIQRLKETVAKVGDQTDTRARRFMSKELKELDMILRKFPDTDLVDLSVTAADKLEGKGLDKTVFDVLGNSYESKGIPVNMRSKKPTSIDKINSTMMNIVTQLNFADAIQTGRGIESVDKSIRNMFGRMPGHVINERDERVLAASVKLAKLHARTSFEFVHVSNLAEFGKEVGNEAIHMKNIEGIINEFTGKSGVPKADLDYVTEYHKGRIKYHPAAPIDLDPRSKIESPEYDEIFVLPKKAYAGPISKRTVKMGDGQLIDIAQGIMDSSSIGIMSMFHAFNRTASEILGVGLDETKAALPIDYLKKIATKRVLPTLGAFMAYGVLNRAADQFLGGTPLGEGLTTFGANILASARVAAQGFMDVTGGTAAAKYLEDLMPGTISSPASGLVRGVGPIVGGMMVGARFGPRRALQGGIVGAAIGGLLGGGPLGLFGLWDVSKSRKEVVEELTGETDTAVRKGRWWELNSSPFEGTRIEYFRPHIYALTRGDYKRAPGFKDSLMTEFVGAIWPDIYAMKNYYSRPYPVTAGLFAGIPYVSDMMRSVPGVGKMLGGGIPMHDEVSEGAVSTGYMMRRANQLGLGTETIADMFGNKSGMYGFAQGGSGPGVGGIGGKNMTPNPFGTSDPEYAIGENVNTMKDIVGLRGWLMGTAFESVTGRRDLFDESPTLASPVDVAGARRSYWDLELGGLMGATEVLRRYIPHKRNQIQVYNPIRNTMPDWMPGKDYYIDFQHGDPYTTVVMGEARLPGPSYETVHDVSLEMPLEGEVIGEDLQSQVSFLLGLPADMAMRNRKKDMVEGMKASVLLSAKRFGDIVKQDTHLYSPSMDLHTSADAIIRAANGKKIPLTIAPKGTAAAANLNAFLVMSDINQGLLMEVDYETGATTERMVNKDVRAFEKNLATARKAQMAARNQVDDLIKSGEPYNLENAYSWFDRYRILADVAPYSKEFKRADTIVQQQILAGRLSRDASEYYTIKNQVEQKSKAFEFSEYRFSDMGKTLTAYGKARDKAVREEYSFAEQMAGEAWEKASHLRNFVQLKFLNNQSPLEAYSRQAIYGKEMKMWQIPPMDYLTSQAYLISGETNPIQGFVTSGITGFLLGGGPVGMAMGAGGALLATFNRVTGRNFVPERVLERREVVNQMDAVKYVKFQKLYEETGDVRYRLQASRTITGAGLSGRVMTTDMVGFPLSTPERNYTEAIINNITTDNLDRAAALLPAPAVASMYSAIGQPAVGRAMMRDIGKQQAARELPGLESSIYSPDVPLASPMITTMNQAGMNAHDAGYGWYDQQAALIRSQSMGVYGGEGLYPGRFESKVTAMDFSQSVNEQNQIRNALRSYASNVMIFDDGMDRIEVEVVYRT